VGLLVENSKNNPAVSKPQKRSETSYDLHGTGGSMKSNVRCEWPYTGSAGREQHEGINVSLDIKHLVRAHLRP
jgi:hypothetical protein